MNFKSVIWAFFSLVLLSGMAVAQEGFYSITRSSTPFISGLSDVEIPLATQPLGPNERSVLINLLDKVSHPSFRANEMTYSFGQSSNGVISCRVEARFVFACEAPKKTGTETMTILVQTPDRTFDVARFNVIVRPTGTVIVQPQSGVPAQQMSQVIVCSVDSARNITCTSSGGTQAGAGNIVIRFEGPGITAQPVTAVFAHQNTPPIFSSIPEKNLRDNEGAATRIIDLWAYASDNEDVDKSRLTFTIPSQSSFSTLNCFIDAGRYVSCDAPSRGRTGTNTLTIQVRDSQGATATQTGNITVFSASRGTGNTAPTLSNLPIIRVSENAGYRSELVDLWDYAFDREDPDSSLDFRVTRQSDTSLVFCRVTDNRFLECEPPRRNTTGLSIVSVEVEDRGGASDSDSFDVEVGPGTGSCGSISVETRAIRVDSNEKRRVSLELRNSSYNDFLVDDVDVSESSQYIGVRNITFDRVVEARTNARLEFEVETFNYSGSREATVTIDVRGEFVDGGRCRFSDARSNTLRVLIDGGGGTNIIYSDGRARTRYSDGTTIYSDGRNIVYNTPYPAISTCNDVSIRATDVSVPENSTRTKTITVRNDSSRTFYIDNVYLSEASAYFDAELDRKPGRVLPGSSEDIVVSISAKSVNVNRAGHATISVAGNLSDSTYCSSSRLYTDLRINVRDEGSAVGGDRSYGDGYSGTQGLPITIEFSEGSLAMKAGEAKNLKVSIANSGSRVQCVDLSTSGTRVFEARLSQERVCVEPDSKESITISIRATNPGSGSVQLTASYAGTSKSEFLSIEVVEGAIQQPEVTVITKPGKENNYAIELVNAGQDITSATISVSAPEGIAFESVSKQLWRKGETVKLEGKVGEKLEGRASITVKVAAGSYTKEFPLEIEVPKKAVQPEATGLAGLATTTGVVVVFLVVLGLAVIGVVSLVSRK